MTMPDVQVEREDFNEKLIAGADRARMVVSEVASKLDTGLLSGAPVDAIEVLQAARDALNALIGDAQAPTVPWPWTRHHSV